MTKRACQSGIAGPGPLAAELWDEVLYVLEREARLFLKRLKSWHGAVLLDDCSPRAVALRLRLARRSLGLAEESFFESWRLLPGLMEHAPSRLRCLSMLVELAVGS